MQKRKRSLWQFTKKVLCTSSSTPSMPMSKGTQSSKWYQGIATLPLSRYIDVAVDGNYSALIISGFPSQLELQLAWSKIQQEDADAAGDHEHKLYISLFTDINAIKIKLIEVRELVKNMVNVYHHSFADRLNNLLLTNFKFNPEKPEEYFKLLQGCLNRAKGWQLDLELKEIHFKAIQEKNETKGVKLTREYFQSILITISDHAKYPLISDNITVFEFRERIKRYNHHCEQLEKQARKYGR